MKKIMSNLEGRTIVMISDYVEDYDEEDIKSEKEFLQSIKEQLNKDGIPFHFIEVKTLQELDEKLKVFDPEKVIIFNWCEEINGIHNSGNEVTKYLEEKGYIFTGATTETLELNHNKTETKKVLLENAVSTPKYFISSNDGMNELPQGFSFPLIVKTSKEHGSLGITENSVVSNFDELNRQIKEIRAMYSQDALIEDYIAGREYAVSIWGNGKPKMLPIIEIDFERSGQKHNIQDYDSKWVKTSKEYRTIKAKKVQNIGKDIEKRIEDVVLKAYKVTKCRGYARMDVRVTTDGIPYVIDVNANPAFLPGVSTLLSIEIVGYNYGQAVKRICEFSLADSKVLQNV